DADGRVVRSPARRSRSRPCEDRARRRGAQPGADPRGRHAADRRARDRAGVDAGRRRGGPRRHGDAIPALRRPVRPRAGAARDRRARLPGRLPLRRAAARPGRAGRRPAARLGRDLRRAHGATRGPDRGGVGAAGPRARAVLRDAPGDAPARGGAAVRPRVHRAGASGVARAGAAPLRARAPRLVARARAERLARADRRALRV
ncbi:MAG: Transcriptional regulator, AcrR family, partial [uncultured Solirubrobacteraceae bacterium]